MTEADLKPCPCCLSSARIDTLERPGEVDDGWVVICCSNYGGCPITTDAVPPWHVEDVARGWNRRDEVERALAEVGRTAQEAFGPGNPDK